MNPIILMAMYGRKPLVEVNLRLLAKENCKVIVVCSDQTDIDFVKALALGTNICIHPNKPLGKKWQAGVDKAKELGADPLIILGSDDFLSEGFVTQACKLSEHIDFTFFTHWHIHDTIRKKNYSLTYKNIFPLGSGRIFSKKYLDKKAWRLFDHTKEKHLDDYAFDQVQYDDQIIMNPQGMKLGSVKGRWDSINPLDTILNSDGIKWKEEKNINDYFGFDVQKTFNGL